MYWIWKAFPKCCTPFSNTVPSKLYNRLYLSFFFFPPENPTYSEFKWPCMEEGKQPREWHKNKGSHKDQILCTLKKKIFNSILFGKSDVLFNYLPISNPGNSDSEDGRQKKKKRERDIYPQYLLIKFLKEHCVWEKWPNLDNKV